MPRDKGPQVFVKVDLDHGIALVSGPRGREILDALHVPYRPSRKGKPRGLVIPAARVPEVEAHCQFYKILAIITGLPKTPRPPVEPVFVAPEAPPEPVPDPFEQDDLF